MRQQLVAPLVFGRRRLLQLDTAPRLLGTFFGLDLIAMSRGAPEVDVEAFRADQAAVIDGELADPYER